MLLQARVFNFLVSTSCIYTLIQASSCEEAHRAQRDLGSCDSQQCPAANNPDRTHFLQPRAVPASLGYRQGYPVHQSRQHQPVRAYRNTVPAPSSEGGYVHHSHPNRDEILRPNRQTNPVKPSVQDSKPNQNTAPSNPLQKPISLSDVEYKRELTTLLKEQSKSQGGSVIQSRSVDAMWNENQNRLSRQLKVLDDFKKTFDTGFSIVQASAPALAPSFEGILKTAEAIIQRDPGLRGSENLLQNISDLYKQITKQESLGVATGKVIPTGSAGFAPAEPCSSGTDIGRQREITVIIDNNRNRGDEITAEKLRRLLRGRRVRVRHRQHHCHECGEYFNPEEDYDCFEETHPASQDSTTTASTPTAPQRHRDNDRQEITVNSDTWKRILDEVRDDEEFSRVRDSWSRDGGRSEHRPVWHSCDGGGHRDGGHRQDGLREKGARGRFDGGRNSVWDGFDPDRRYPWWLLVN